MRWPWQKRVVEGTMIALNPSQWIRVAECSSSDYHDWIDAFRASEAYTEDGRVIILVSEREARWIADLFGEDAIYEP